MSCGVGRRRSLELVLLWLWRRPAATAPILLAWEPPHAAGAVLKRQKTKNNNNNASSFSNHFSGHIWFFFSLSFNLKGLLLYIQSHVNIIISLVQQVPTHPPWTAERILIFFLSFPLSLLYFFLSASPVLTLGGGGVGRMERTGLVTAYTHQWEVKKEGLLGPHFFKLGIYSYWRLSSGLTLHGLSTLGFFWLSIFKQSSLCSGSLFSIPLCIEKQYNHTCFWMRSFSFNRDSLFLTA